MVFSPALLSLAVVALGQGALAVSEWGQCGGIGYGGSTSCDAGLACIAMNDYYFQCQKASGSATSASATSGSATTATVGTSAPAATATGKTTYTILAGGYSSAINTYTFDTAAKTLKLTATNQVAYSPSWLELSKQNSSILYATVDSTQGGVQSFTIGANGKLTGPISQMSSGGDGPAHLASLSTGEVAVMNYNSGNGKVISTTNGGTGFISGAPLISFTKTPSHPHMAYEHGSEILVPDLGADVIWRLTKSNGAWGVSGSIPQPSGSGPRHIAIYQNNLYTVHELASTLTVQPMPAAGASSNIVSQVSTVPADAPSGGQWAAAEIFIPPPTTSFPTPYIYVSNRNKAKDSDDTIAIFQLTSSGQLSLVKQVHTGLSQVRGMEFGGPDNRYLIAGAASGSAGVAVFERTSSGADLQLIARSTEVAQRFSFIWL